MEKAEIQDKITETRQAFNLSDNWRNYPEHMAMYLAAQILARLESMEREIKLLRETVGGNAKVAGSASARKSSNKT